MARKWTWGRLLDPLVLALGLNLAVGIAATASGGIDTALSGWTSGFSELFGFAMQMVLMLVLGHTLATTPLLLRQLELTGAWVAARPRPAAWIAVLTAGLSWLHWGIGLVGGGLLARAAAARDEYRGAATVRYTAAAYGAFIVWHGGLSGSAPLLMASEGHFLSDLVGAVPLEATLFSPLNLALLGLVTLAVALAIPRLPLGTVVMHRAAEHTGWEAAEAELPKGWGGIAVGGALLAVILAAWQRGALGIDLNFVILMLFALCLIGHQDLDHFQAAAKAGLGDTVGIVVQFPLYGAVMGMMRESGLAAQLSEALVAGAVAGEFPLAAFLSAGLLNMIVPSGGGQWAVQGPILLAAGAKLGVPAGDTIIAFSWGDAWTNLIQPFWALPLLALTGVRAQDVLKLTAPLLLLTGAVICATLLLLT